MKSVHTEYIFLRLLRNYNKPCIVMDIYQESNLLFQDLCRLCLVHVGTTFIDDGVQQNVLVCTGVEVLVTDNLPSKICGTCYEIVSKAIEFREAVTKNDSLLKTLYSDLENEHIINYAIVIKDENEDSNMEIESNNCETETQIDDVNSDQNYTYSCIVNLTSTSTPLGTLTIRKDLFPSSVQETQKENMIHENKDKTSSQNQEDAIQDKCEEKTEETQKDEIDYKNNVKTKPKCEEKDVIVYKCQDCDKSFKTWRKLYHHKRQHKKTKACPVKECGKMFYSKSDLEKHIRIHTGVKPYRCNLCDKSFTQKCTLNNHKDAVH